MEGIKKEKIDIPKIPGLYNILGLGDDNNIISFPYFDFDKERKKNIKNKNELSQLLQYYLFLAYYLEKAKKEESSLKYLLENISIQDLNKKEGIVKNNENSAKLINELILRLYKLAYKHSDKKHRDFPYYSFYIFLIDIDSEELKTLNNEFTEEEEELNEIYTRLIIEKQQIQFKKMQKMQMMSFRNNTSGNLNRASVNYKPNNNSNTNTSIINETNENNYDLAFRKSNVDSVKSKLIGSSKKINLLSLLHKRQSIQVNKPLLEIENEPNNNSVDFNINISYVINTTS